MFAKKKIEKTFTIFLALHLIVWTLIPTYSNVNLPLDTIEALAWGSNLDWGFNKHPPMSAFVVEFFYQFIGDQDWGYYLLSQIFVISAFYIVWIFSKDFFQDTFYSLVSILLLEGIYFYNFTTPEFNVNVCQLPFWALSVLYAWRGFKNNKTTDWLLLGIFASLGVLSKYLFLYLLISIGIFFLYTFLKRNFNSKILYTLFPLVIILMPHINWLLDNDFVTIKYGLNRTGFESKNFIDHLFYPSIFLIKQIGILIPFLAMFLFLLKNFKAKFLLNLRDKKLLFLTLINMMPIILIFLTSLLMGVKIRTMWMTPFYLFFGVFLVYIFQNNIDKKKMTKFLKLFFVLFILSPLTYLYISLSETNKRTDFPGKEIARLVQKKWDDNFINEIKIVVGDEWYAGNLSYHLSSRPIWVNSLKNKTSKITFNEGVIYTGNPKILKKICPGVFGTIKPVGYCMIGQK